MSDLLNNDHRFAGTVKFDTSVPVEKLKGFISTMKLKTPERWVDLHIRSAGDDGTHYMAFHYILKDGEKKTYKKAFHSLRQFLCNQLGTCPKKGKEKSKPFPQGVHGWNISTVLAVI